MIMFKHNSGNRPLILVFAIIIGGLLGCSPAAQKAMVVENIPEAKKHPFTVSVVAQGGSEAGAFDNATISNEDFAKAIEQSIVKIGLFSKVINVQGSDYELSVTIVDLSRPAFGFNMTVEMEAAWSLMHRQSRNIVMRRSIKSSNTATLSEEFSGASRLRLAVERAARENIRLGLNDISKLDLK
jgi:hypothetical protein